MLRPSSVRSGLVAGVVCGILAILAGAPAAEAVETPMTISTTAVDFGQVLVGSTAQVSVTLTNSGTEGVEAAIKVTQRDEAFAHVVKGLSCFLEAIRERAVDGGEFVAGCEAVIAGESRPYIVYRSEDAKLAPVEERRTGSH